MYLYVSSTLVFKLASFSAYKNMGHYNIYMYMLLLNMFIYCMYNSSLQVIVVLTYAVSQTNGLTDSNLYR